MTLSTMTMPGTMGGAKIVFTNTILVEQINPVKTENYNVKVDKT